MTTVASTGCIGRKQNDYMETLNIRTPESGFGCMDISADYGPPADRNQGIAFVQHVREMKPSFSAKPFACREFAVLSKAGSQK
jgi:hypothetical protein